MCTCAAPNKVYRQLEHSTWDCLLRFWKQYWYCPCVLPDDNREPAQWACGSMTRAANLDWVALIEQQGSGLALPLHDCAQVPPFQL
jgi:hypothetical protein